MKQIKNYKAFFEAFLERDKETAIENIISYITKNTSVDLYLYNELYHIQKGSLFLTGQLYLSLNTSKAIRINWIKGDMRSEIHSIDVWLNFDFELEGNPNYTLELGENSVVKVLSEIVIFFNDPKQYVNLYNKQGVYAYENYNPSEELEQTQKKLGRARSQSTIDKLERRIEHLKAVIASDERVEKDSDKIDQSELKIDVFKAIELYTIQVSRGRSNSLIVTGQSGIGKTATVIDALKSIGFIADVNFYKATGTVTTAALYETLFLNRNKLVIFDDCDVVFKDPDSINLLKGALDTYDVRELSKLTKGNTFNSTGMSDSEIEEEYQSKDGKILPNRFEFRGQVIFISNLPEDNFDKAILTRSLHVDVHLNKKEVIDRMRELMVKISPDVPMDEKEEALQYLVYITENYPVKFDLNIRTLIHSINLRSGSNDKMSTMGGDEFIWKLLIKKYLVKNKNR
jgi:hypothetical protein